MRLDVIRRFVPRHCPTILPVPGRIDATILEPQLQRLSNDNRPRTMRGCCHIDDRHELGGKRHTDLTEA